MSLSKLFLSALLVLPLLGAGCADDQEDTNCDNGRCDGRFGWIEEGDSCFDFNAECTDSLVCLPVDIDEENQVCGEPAVLGAFCDDSDDCAGELTCHGEIWNQAGTCQPPRVRCFEDSDCASESATSTCRPELLIGMSNFCGEPGGIGAICNGGNDNDCQSELFCNFEVVDSIGLCAAR